MLGIVGTLFLFAGSMLLIGETRLALRALSSEMAFTLRMTRQYIAGHQAPDRDEAMASIDRMSAEVTKKMPGGRQAGTQVPGRTTWLCYDARSLFRSSSWPVHPWRLDPARLHVP